MITKYRITVERTDEDLQPTTELTRTGGTLKTPTCEERIVLQIMQNTTEIFRVEVSTAPSLTKLMQLVGDK